MPIHICGHWLSAGNILTLSSKHQKDKEMLKVAKHKGDLEEESFVSEVLESKQWRIHRKSMAITLKEKKKKTTIFCHIINFISF